jgi:hypothetical protein
MTKMKALSVLQCRQYVLDHQGAEGIERVKAVMYEAARDEVYSPLLLPTDWVEVGHALEHALAYDRVFSEGGGHAASERMLRHLVAQHYTGLYRSMFTTRATPMMVIDKSSRLWGRFYDQGESVLIVHSPSSVTKRILGCPDMPRFHDLITTPYYEELMRQSGAQGVNARHTKCVALGAEYCETLINWQEGRMSAAAGGAT